MADGDINQAVNKMMESLDKSTFRPMQKNGYVCSVKCFDNKDCSAEQLQACIQRCQEPVAQVQNYLNQELSSFQNRLQRCAMDCQDRAQDGLSARPSESEIASAQSNMEKCVSKCVDSHIKLLPALKKRIEEATSSIV
ncbi:unnamed protein product [Aphanomyces euteiches]|uniref:Protein FAM136A n=1 Tax=Aphanomyces euteiches TaxID=100861 RepID=A0A6G0WE45_9STRA|nr:hypothetical protein Ae201684_015941 [Aphanomyces euteiches]KAH9088342.1 hypothetical protein Ae201684P_003036 [Aphanomyces euteiches]